MGKLILFTGAGLSAESGLATFRGTSGLWNGHKIGEVCDITTWKANFEAVHAFYDNLRLGLAEVEPNAAHRAIAGWQSRYETINLTTNIDDLLERAGCTDVFHVHGSLGRMHCTACGSTWAIGHEAWGTQNRCMGGKAHCQSIRGVKPNVVFFHESTAKPYGHMYRTFREMKKDDVALFIGSSGLVVKMEELIGDKPGFHILSNLGPVPDGERLFDHAIYKPVTQAIDEIDALLRERLG